MEKKKRWWIANQTFNWFKSIHLKSSSSQNGSWEELIYFDSEAEAVDFERKLKEFILSNYHRAKKEGWYK